MFTGPTGWGPKLIAGSRGEGRLGQAVWREEATPGATHTGGRKEPRVDTERPLDRGIPGALQPTDSCSAARGDSPATGALGPTVRASVPALVPRKSRGFFLHHCLSHESTYLSLKQKLFHIFEVC